MIRTVTIDIINEKALKLLKELELLQLIRVRKEAEQQVPLNWTDRYKGAMTKQSTSDIEAQLHEIRNSWE